MNKVGFYIELSTLTRLGSELLTNEEIKRLEQVWLVLSELFQDLNRRNIKVDVASDLRNCKTLINFIRVSVTYPPRESMGIDGSLRDLMQVLDKIQSNLMSEALRLDENYAIEWMKKIDKAQRAELDYAMIYTTSEFVPSLPRDPEKGWIRLTLQKPIAEERAQDVAEQFGVIVEFKNGTQIVISGRRDLVKKAIKDFYELSLK